MPFRPPPASRRQLAGVPFDTAVDFAVEAKRRYDEFDRRPNNRDPSKCKALLAFPGRGAEIRAVFWSAKMAIDADGPAAGPGHKKGTELDRTGQNVTSFRFSNGKSLPAEAVAYIVLPQNEAQNGPFDPKVRIGDVAIVMFKDMITAAICADLGPVKKIGEAFMRHGSRRVLIPVRAGETAFAPRLGMRAWRRTCSISCFRALPLPAVN
jgi:hypothetical protein